jgi:hypothetical protein
MSCFFSDMHWHFTGVLIGNFRGPQFKISGGKPASSMVKALWSLLQAPSELLRLLLTPISPLHSASFTDVFSFNGKFRHPLNLLRRLYPRPFERSFAPPVSFRLWVVGILRAPIGRGQATIGSGVNSAKAAVDPRRCSWPRGHGLCLGPATS